MEKDEKTYAPKITSFAILTAVMDGRETTASLTSAFISSEKFTIEMAEASLFRKSLCVFHHLVSKVLFCDIPTEDTPARARVFPIVIAAIIVCCKM